MSDQVVQNHDTEDKDNFIFTDAFKSASKSNAYDFGLFRIIAGKEHYIISQCEAASLADWEGWAVYWGVVKVREIQRRLSLYHT